MIQSHDHDPRNISKVIATEISFRIPLLQQQI